MAEQDGRRRLELVKKPVEVPPFAARVPAPRAAIGVADVSGQGPAAVAWAAELAMALAARRPISLAVLSFHGEPHLPLPLNEALNAANVPVITHAVGPGVGGLQPVFERLAALPPTLWLCVGEPAVALLDPWFELLVGTDAPLSRWLPSLRPRAGLAALEVPQARLSLARVLGQQLMLP